MPRVKRNSEKDPGAEAYDLTPDEIAFERRIHDSESSLLDKVKTTIDSGKVTTRDMYYCATALAKLRSELRARYKLFGRIDLGAKAVAEDPAKARLVVANYLGSLSNQERAEIYDSVHGDETLITWLASMEEARLKSVFRHTREVRHGQADAPEPQPHPMPLLMAPDEAESPVG